MNQVVFVTIANSRTSCRETEVDVFGSEVQARDYCRSYMIERLLEAREDDDDDTDQDDAICDNSLASLRYEDLVHLAAEEECYCEYRPYVVSCEEPEQ